MLAATIKQAKVRELPKATDKSSKVFRCIDPKVLAWGAKSPRPLLALLEQDPRHDIATSMEPGM